MWLFFEFWHIIKKLCSLEGDRRKQFNLIYVQIMQKEYSEQIFFFYYFGVQFYKVLN